MPHRLPPARLLCLMILLFAGIHGTCVRAQKQTVILPDHQRQIVDLPGGEILRPLLRYAFSLEIEHDAESKVYLSPYGSQMVLPRIELDYRDGRTLATGEFYLLAPEPARLLVKVLDHTPARGTAYVRELVALGKVAQAAARPTFRDQPPAGALRRLPLPALTRRDRWNRTSDRYEAPHFGLGIKPDSGQLGPQYFVDNLDLPTAGYRYVALQLTNVDITAGDLRYYSLRVAEQNQLGGRVGVAPLYPLVEGSRTTYYVRIPEGMERIRSIGFHYDRLAPPNSVRNPRTLVRIDAAALTDRLPALNEDDDNAGVIKRQFQEAAPGEVLDFAFLPVRHHHTLLFDGVEELTVRNLILYDTRNRLDNRGESQHFLSAGRSCHIRLDNVQCWGFANEIIEEVPLGRRHPLREERINTPLVRYWDPVRGPSYRIDIGGARAGDTVRLYYRGGARVLHESVLQGEDTEAIFFRKARLLPSLDIEVAAAGGRTGSVMVRPYGRVRHRYDNEFSAGLIGGGGMENWTVTNFHVEGMRGDGFQIQPGARDVTLRGVTSLGSMRQGWSVNGGSRIAVHGATAIHCGRSCIDIEPYSEGWRVDSLVITDARVGSYRFNGFVAHNWHRNHRVHIDGFRDLGYGRGNTWAGGYRDGSLRNANGIRFNIAGRNLYIDSISAEKITLTSGEDKPDDVTGGRIVSGQLYATDFELRVGSLGRRYQLAVEDGCLADGGRIPARYFDPEAKGNRYASLLRTEGSGEIRNLDNELYAEYFPAMVTGPVSAARSISKSAAAAKVAAPKVTYELNRIEEGYHLPAGTYYYRVDLVLPEGSTYALPERRFQTNGRNGHPRLRIVEAIDPATGRIYYEYDVYVGRAGGQYDRVFRVRKAGEHAGLDATPSFDHYGDTLRMYAGHVRDDAFYGYPDMREEYAVFAAEKLVRRK